MTWRTAVIGAGLAGLACARELRRAGSYVEVFEKERIIGGRIATSRAGMVNFDHGAQYLTARSSIFKTYVNELTATGYAAKWEPRTMVGTTDLADETVARLATGWFVGTPGMSSIVRPLAEGVRISTNRTVHTIERVEKGWRIWFDDQTHEGPFKAVAVAVPAPQARLLLGPAAHLADDLGKVRISPCWALMVRLDDQVFPPQDVFSDMSDTIRWIARNNTKPGRSSRGESVVVHASLGWSRETEDADPQLIADDIWDEVSNILGLPPIRPAQMTAHLWKYGIVESSLGESFIFSGDHNVGIAGDWCLGRLAEHAFESGIGLGRAIVNSIY
ncbi:MAG: FAD-dependent oxidoreductase [Pseudomonadota bacterium]